MRTVELGSDVRRMRVQSGHGICGDTESWCSPSILRSFSLVLVLALFGALAAFVSIGGWGIGGFRRLNVRQPCQLCKETAAGTLPVTSYESTAKALPLRYESIAEIYATYNQTPGLDHWGPYGPAYDENIQHLREIALREKRRVNMLEIGVQSGGSTRVWKRYFRGLTQYLGLDIEPRCRMFQSLEEGIRIITGSQLDTALLSKICTDYGPFDLVVDDGGHTNAMIQTSLKSLWNCMKDNGVYVIEDLHTMNMGGYIGKTETSVFQEIAEWMRIRSPNIVDQARKELINHPSNHLKKLSFRDSILFLHYGKDVPALFQNRVHKGSHWISGPLMEPTEELSLSDWCPNCCIGCYDI